ncbi:MAG TPA: type I polyketide synthase, partial [Vicinamibacterales bacterium]|nr:type I polyketide synthase [Vicinamibacterales bacterium]
MQDSAIAIVGAAGRFPGARSLDEFWRNLDDGRETLTRFSSEELRASGVNPALWSQPDWVPVAGVAPDVQLFDADFFGLAHGEARATCPQHRIFLEHCWEALETAGYDPGRYRGRVGVFAGSNASTYLLFNILSNSGLIDLLGHAPTMIATDKDYLATRASYALNLRGPSVAVNTACSTSLVAVHMACQSLLLGECDMALAGAATVHTPPGYLHQPGLPLSPDGRCRPFDANAEGSGVGSGAGVVLLKPLADAERDADPILAIIRGSAMNNDGASKVSYTAPSVTGEEEVISEALGVAGVDPRTISYVETHGTGTPLGDPVELEALARVFRRGGAERQACGIGSVKSNLGHLGAAAGIAGLLKVVLALQHRRLPASLNFTTPNPRLGLHESPFRVVATTEDWNGPSPRRAGVSSFGVGGTNCHVVVEEPRPIVVDPLPPRSELLLWSARTPAALGRMTERLAGDLANRPDLRLRDVAFTLGAGRAVFRCRRALVASGLADAAERLAATDLPGVLEGRGEIGARPVAFLFPGGGAQQAGMAASLFQTEPVFRDALLRCRDAALPLLGVDLQTILATTVRAGEDPDD